MPDILPDSGIITLYNRRDEQAIQATADKYGSFCLGISYDILGSREDAEECVNDTYLRVWNSIPPARPASLQAFLATVTRRISLDRYRERRAAKRNRDFDLSLEELAECIPMRDEEAGELTALLDEFLESLPEAEWKLFCGRYWHNIPVGELATIHGIPAKKVSMRLFRTREKLRLFLNERGYSL